jgi:hypothetical protein
MNPNLALWFEIVKLLVAALTPHSIYVAYKAYRANLQKQAEDRMRDADRELLAQAQRSLEWAYNVLTNDGATIPPEANRLNWLTSSRHLLRHRTIANRIQSDIYRTVHAEHEEFWRHRFYLALNHNELAMTRYYEKETNRQDDWPENIEISSALVIVHFSNWPKDLKDPTNSVDRQAILNEESALVGRAGRGLRAYVRALDEARTRMRQPGEA